MKLYNGDCLEVMQDIPNESVQLILTDLPYAETGSKYIEVLQKIINQNNLKDFDEARLLPSSKDLESLIIAAFDAP